MKKWVYKAGLHHFLTLIYPNICSGCSNKLTESENAICLQCLATFKNEDLITQSKKYIGKFLPKQFIALGKFQKQAPAQKLLHQLKYNNEPEIGITLGKELAYSHTFVDIDYILPMPIHPKKLKTRGYNQSTKIAEGIKVITNIPIKEHLLIKTKDTLPQAKKNKAERHIIDKTLFKTPTPEELKHKHILLVDDVITTGATLESAIIPLLKIEGIKISIAVIAVT